MRGVADPRAAQRRPSPPPLYPGGRVAEDGAQNRRIREGWEWMLNRALGLPCQEPEWFHLPVMRRIAISTPNVMAALRHLRRDQARPYNFALSPVLVNLAGTQV